MAQVTWRSEGVVPFVKFFLRRVPPTTNSLSTCLATNVSNTGSYDLIAPIGKSPGEYLLEVRSSSDESVSGHVAVAIDRNCTPPSISDVIVETDWRGGTDQLVRWSSTGAVPEVSITLRNDRTILDVNGLARHVTNTGSQHVTVPIGRMPGSYLVEVRSTAEFSVRASAPVTIDRDCEPPTLGSVTSETEWEGGSTQLVRWSSSGAVPEVNLAIRKLSGLGILDISSLSCLARLVPNTGSASVVVPVGRAPGEYRVEVRSATDTSVKALGEPVMLDRTRLPPAIKDVTIQYAKSHGGSIQRVTWSSEGAVPEVTILLRRDGHFVSILCHKLENCGMHDVLVPIGRTPGEYFFEVRSCADNTVKASSSFIIDDEHRDRCVEVALLLLGLPPRLRLPYSLLLRIAIMSQS
jgi:hypothetical protein